MSILARIPVNGSGEIRVSLGEYKGAKYVDVRKFYYEMPDGADTARIADRPEEDFKPTAKGITLPTTEIVDEVLVALTTHRDAIEAFLRRQS